MGEEWGEGRLQGPPGPAVDTKGPLAPLGGNWSQLGAHWADWKHTGDAVGMHWHHSEVTGITLG